MDLRLTEHVVIVTGASHGLGRSIANVLAEEGMKVVAVGRDTPALTSLATERTDSIAPFVCDISDLDAIAGIPAFAIARFGRVDALVNNAAQASNTPLADQTLDDWEQIFRVNITAPMLLTQSVGTRFIGQGRGKVVNIASLAGITGRRGMSAYSATKGALLRFTESVADEWARHNVQVNAIAPGSIDTEAMRRARPDAADIAAVTKHIPARRLGAPAEVGRACAFLLSPQADYITGTTVVIDGGLHVHTRP
ncbi:glucose 1-dehydrogenase [Gordonia sp. HNM0687]|uniref:3-oxoacyl-[acyl-carrier-protein] reductase MabA n=1 Tax=Gordonia mangrovi TaxID=2665643 RepID=A0A6L7GZ37_9ACTN|nr:SDR family oxidoreductase [Gordonia mangrovi]MXP24188.1 glucose 1-dehydrogenase [Gordonia mangrovi]UVF76920.1 SDR family oxidoreductase [Gordonia mangrovi]